MNPTLVEGQVQGGLSQAIGAALMEELLYDPDSGQMRNGTMMGTTSLLGGGRPAGVRA